MALTEKQPDLRRMQDRAHKVYGAWLLDHVDGQLVTPRDYNPDEKYQQIDIVRMEPEPSIDIAIGITDKISEACGGPEGYNQLVKAVQDMEIDQLLLERQAAQESTLVTTLHLQNTLDTPLTHNIFYVASGGKPEIADINCITVNPMMSRMNIGGLAVYKVLTASGEIEEMLPIDGAKKYHMDEPTITYLIRRTVPNFTGTLKRGVAMHWAPSGTRAKDIILADGTPAKLAPQVEESIVQIIRRRLKLAIPMPLNVSVGNFTGRVLEPRIIKKDGDVHEMMGEMAEVASDLSGSKVFYGELPKGAQEVKKVRNKQAKK